MGILEKIFCGIAITFIVLVVLFLGAVLIGLAKTQWENYGPFAIIIYLGEAAVMIGLLIAITLIFVK